MDDVVHMGERVVIVNDYSPSYRLTRISYSDIRTSNGKVKPRYISDVELPPHSLPSEIKVVCTDPFGEGAAFRVGRVSHLGEDSFYIPETGLHLSGEFRCSSENLFAPLDSKYKRMRLQMDFRQIPISGNLFWLVEFRYPT